MKLEAGDVLIQGDTTGGAHALMWIDGEKPLVHSSNDGFLGVLLQSMGYLGKFIVKSNEWTDVDCGVYRYQGNVGHLKRKACEFAERWATRVDDVNKDALAGYRTKDKPEVYNQMVLRTPFSARRLGESFAREKKTGQAVSVETIFRVLKAIARTEMGSTLSPNHGVSCSQFVVYCYQAAALSLQIGQVLPPQLMSAMQGKGKGTKPDAKAYIARDLQGDGTPEKFWRDKAWGAEQGLFRSARSMAGDEQAVSLLQKVLGHNQRDDYYKSMLPPGMNIDPLSYGVQYLRTQLRGGESSFRFVGELRGRMDEMKRVEWDIVHQA